MTIKGKILIPMIALTVVCAAAVLVTTIFLYNGYVNGVMDDLIKSSAAVSENSLKSIEKQAYNASAQIAKDPDIINAILSGDRDSLINISGALLRDSGMEFCTIGDANGKALARPHKPESYGDDINAMPSVKSALSGKSLTVMEEGVSVRMSLCSGTPVYDGNKNLIGVVVVGCRMDTNTFVDTIKSLMKCETTIFLRDERISTTIVKDDGTRAVGSKADGKVSGEVLAGNTYIGNVQILNRDALGYYTPIYGADGGVIGMLFVGRYMTEKTDIIWSFVISGCVIMLIILIIGILVAVFISNSLEAQIRNLINRIKNSTRKIESSTSGLTEISSNLADGSSKQAAAIEETSATMTESASMITQTAENTRQAAQLAKKSKDNANTSKEKIQEMVRAMNELKESSDTISKIIKTIDTIAFQTNLLAINATVEAARAGGEAGRSFSVVAEEVRNLAKRSAASASNTADIIEKNISLTNYGKKISEEVSDALQVITSEFDRLNQMISEITVASEEQSNGISQVNTAISQMEKVTQQTAAMAEEAAASSQNLREESLALDEVVAEAAKLIKNSENVTKNAYQ